jgi:2-methylisocitrate lyase-like PEP mutase family enzyme
VTSSAQSVSHDVSKDARTLRGLHKAGVPLLLANVWDPPTARVVERAGMCAVATTSAALALVNGYEDHGRTPAVVAFGALRRITAAVALPVTADLEDGYGLNAAELVDRVVEAGVCGFNLEDTDHSVHRLVDADAQAERIAAIKGAARARDVDLVVNARIDVLLHRRPNDEGLERARKYLAAGADCVFPILLSDVATIRAYAAIGTTNVLWRPGGPTLAELAKTNVSRVSVGAFLHHLMLRQLAVATDSLRRFEEDGIWK